MLTYGSSIIVLINTKVESYPGFSGLEITPHVASLQILDILVKFSYEVFKSQVLKCYLKRNKKQNSNTCLYNLFSVC